MDENTPSEQLEEGEIVDDDFEAISDNSIIEPSCGKCVSSNENLRALSLSSDTESELIRQIRHKRKLLHRHRNRKRRKKRKIVIDSSDSDSSPPRDLKGKLKEAIRIDDIENVEKNPLENRLKAMGGLTVPVTQSTPISVESPPIEAKKAEESVDKIDDTELENLRIEALKTAVLNKFQRRKRKKSGIEIQEEKKTSDQILENKENDTPKHDQNDKNNGDKVESNNVNIDLEEDEDVLRASLLAGLAKKIAKKTTPNESVIQPKPVAPKLPIKIAALPKRPVVNFKNSTVNKQIINKKIVHKIVRAKPQVKPLIINLNNDSDTEEEIKQKETNVTVQQKKPFITTTTKISNVTQKVAVKTTQKMLVMSKKQSQTISDINAIENNVEKFLREQRAKFENENKNTPGVNKDKTILEKSAVKLLPKSQQIEYQQLLKRLRNAEKRKRAKNFALQKLEAETATELPKSDQLTVQIDAEEGNVDSATSSTERAPQPKIEIIVQPSPVPSENTLTPTRHEKQSNEDTSSPFKSSRDSDTSEKKVKITNELTTLQKTLKEIKMQRNGSLQIKTKYQVLTPIIRKITETSNERKKQEKRIKTLLQELGEARNSLSNSHEKFSDLVRELVAKKDKIDKSSQESKIYQRKKENGSISKQNNIAHIERNSESNNKKELKTIPVTSTPIKTQIQFVTADEPTISTLVTSSTNHDCEDMDVCNSDETDIGQIDIVDPNDIDQIFKRKPPVKSSIPEYVSPLNFTAYDRYRHVDPLGIMCPYEVNGSCRDIDCTYKHYLKNHERL